MLNKHVASSLVLAAAFGGTLLQAKPAHALMRMPSVQLWPGGTVPVCFEAKLAAQPGFDRFYTVLRNNVENTWARVANVRFTGWGTCPTAWPSGSVVLYYLKGGFNAQVGYSPVGSTSFGVDFNNNNPDNDNSYPARWASVVVHEFGHLLGFDHEMDRADNPYFADHSTGCSGVDGGWPQPGEIDITPYDQSSVMNYCGAPTVATKRLPGIDPSLAWFMPLSAWDVAGVQSIYGAKPGGSLVGLGGRCSTIQGGSTAWGVPVIAEDCTGAEQQLWKRAGDGVDQTLAARFASGAVLALDVPGGSLSTTGFTGLSTYPINNSPGQQLRFVRQQWKAYGDMCVVADSAATNAYLRVQPCTGSSGLERWDFEPNGRIRLNGTGQCVNVPWASAFDGNSMQLYPCSSSTPYPNERFTWTNRSELMYGGKCLNVWRGDMTAGSPIALYSCSGSAAAFPNEVFYTTGAILGLGNKCLDTMTFPDSISRNGQRVGLATCNAAQSQTWDYHGAPR